MVEIQLNDGVDPILLRGYEFGYEICWERVRYLGPEKTLPEKYWSAGKWYPVLSQALNALAEMRIRNSDAQSLEKLIKVVNAVRKETKEIYLAALGQ